MRLLAPMTSQPFPSTVRRGGGILWRPAGARVSVGRASMRPGHRARPGRADARNSLSLNLSPLDSIQYRVFADLLDRPDVALLNEPSGDVPLRQPGYWLLECFPTSSWRTSGLSALPGHQRAPADVVEEFARRLVEVYSLPAGAITRNHDHLQAVVAALPAVGLLGGPARVHARGEPARLVDGVLVEGFIWDAAPVDGTLPALFPRRVVEGVP